MQIYSRHMAAIANTSLCDEVFEVFWPVGGSKDIETIL